MCKSALVSKGTTNWFMTNNFWGYTQATTGSRVGTPTPIMILKTNKKKKSIWNHTAVPRSGEKQICIFPLMLIYRQHDCARSRHAAQSARWTCCCALRNMTGGHLSIPPCFCLGEVRHHHYHVLCVCEKSAERGRRRASSQEMSRRRACGGA